MGGKRLDDGLLLLLDRTPLTLSFEVSRRSHGDDGNTGHG
jgi:hypothetical protein